MRRFTRIAHHHQWLPTMLLASLALALLPSAIARAQDPDYQLRLTDAAGVGGTVDVSVMFDNTGVNVAAWSFGVCHESAVDIVSANMGADTMTVQGGSPPDYESTVVYPGEGWTSGVVVDFMSAVHLSPGTDYELNVASYSLEGVAGQTAEIAFCEGIGVTPIALVVTLEGGEGVVPTTTSGQIEILDQSFHYTIPDQYVEISGGDATAFSVTPTIEEDSNNDGYPNDTSAFSMGVSHDPAYLTFVDVNPTGVIASLNGGTGPDYFAVSTYTDAFTVGCLYDFDMMMPIQYATPQSVMTIEYETLPGVAPGLTTSNLTFATLGDPVVQNVVVAGLTEVVAQPHNGTITMAPDTLGVTFVRGDTNADGSVQIVDAIVTLEYLFQSGVSTCDKAFDSNDDGLIDLSDPVYSLAWQFSGGPAIPAPTSCGFDPTADSLTCDSFDACP